MTVSVATLRVGPKTVLPLRIFINRRQLAQNGSSKTVFETPLLSNNSIVSLKSPKTRIYLSNVDMLNLCNELRDDLLIIIYELTSPVISDTVLQKIRVGTTLDFQENVVNKILDLKSKTSSSDKESRFITSHLTTITRISKLKYKLHFKFNWEVDIYINNTLKLSKIRQNLIFKNRHSTPDIYDRKSTFLLDKSSVIIPKEPSEDVSLLLPEEEAIDKKPAIAIKYKPVGTFLPCIDIHILQRPRRHK